MYLPLTGEDKKLAEVHDQLRLHRPMTNDIHTLCEECKMPITLVLAGENYYQINTTTRNICESIQNTNYYTNTAINELIKTPEGAYFVALSIKNNDEIKKICCRAPETAYRYAINIDKRPSDETRAGACADPLYAAMYASEIDRKPTKETWLSVINSDSMKKSYLSIFKTTEQELINKLRRKS